MTENTATSIAKNIFIVTVLVCVDELAKCGQSTANYVSVTLAIFCMTLVSHLKLSISTSSAHDFVASMRFWESERTFSCTIVSETRLSLVDSTHSQMLTGLKTPPL